MSSICVAMQFVYRVQSRYFRPVRIEERTLAGLKTDLYRHAGRRSKGCILFQHGMNVRANRDPRVINVCLALAGIGYDVVAPKIPQIAGLKIDYSEIESIASAIRETASDPELSRSGKVGLFSISFSGGLCMMAAARPDTRHLVSSTCIVGAHGDVENAVDYFLRRVEQDDYAFMIIMYNFIEYGIGKNPGFARAFYLAAEDAGLRRAEPLHVEYLKALPKQEREMFEKLRTNPLYREEMRERIKQKLKEKRILLDELSPIEYLDGIESAVTLMHGTDDPVISADESRLMHKRLVWLKKKSRLFVTDAIVHGDHKLGFKQIIGVRDLVRGFANFFSHI